jgi:hypothetical protein
MRVRQNNARQSVEVRFKKFRVIGQILRYIFGFHVFS